MGSGVAVNESSFGKRLGAVAQWPQNGAGGLPVNPAASITQLGFYEDREIFRPYAGANAGATPGNFAAATVAITTVSVGPPLDVALTNGNTTVGANTIGTLITTTVAGVNTDFVQGMPGQLPNGSGASPTGGPVLPGDILVVNGVKYDILRIADATHLIVTSTSPATIAATADWFILLRSERLSHSTPSMPSGNLLSEFSITTRNLGRRLFQI
jgi:hypothetical protein